MAWKSYRYKETIRITEMFSCFEASYDYDFDFTGDPHNFWECVYVLEGQILATADERNYTLCAGEIIFHKPLEIHRFHVTGKSGVKIFVFSFSAEGELCRFFHDKVFLLSNEQRVILDNLLKFMNEKVTWLNIPKYTSNTQYIHFLLPFEKIPTYAHTVVSHLHMLFLSLSNDNTPVSSESTSSDSIIFRDAVNYMNQHIYKNLHIDEVAKQVNLSSSSIQRIFARFTGMGFHKYFVLMKLKTATKLINSGNSVTETAEKLGFSSQSYFSKAYKRELGYYPSTSKSK